MNRLAIVAASLLFAWGAAANTPEAAPETFEVGKGTFLLNGEPFVVKAAEIHYPRIPEPYWEQRIESCKALGMNAICLYVFWNIHEPEPGKFDFTGNNDIARFCRLAQKHGMYVIVRPGPYVCAEWEMGGLPWWLLKKEDVKLRTLDPYYMERVRLFMNEVGKQLADLQLSRGGNILMVQVENEYGAYATDKAYRQLVKMVNALVMVEGEEAYADFVAEQNSLIKRYKQQVLGQTVSPDKEDDEEPEEPAIPGITKFYPKENANPDKPLEFPRNKTAVLEGNGLKLVDSPEGKKAQLVLINYVEQRMPHEDSAILLNTDEKIEFTMMYDAAEGQYNFQIETYPNGTEEAVIIKYPETITLV